MQNIRAFPVQVKKVVRNKLIILEWEAADGKYNTQVEMNFEPLNGKSTMVKISESGWHDNQRGFESSYKNCEGWTHMSCCLKAYAEYGINLRKGLV